MIKANTGVHPEPHYYSDRLVWKLQQINFLPVVIVDAPSGYGKTTAVRDLLETLPPDSASVHWFTAVSEAPTVSFQRLCRVLEGIDGLVGRRLMSLGLPNAATVGETCDAFRSIKCRRKTYLVLDNFQYIQGTIALAFWEALLGHGIESLHLVLITQQLTAELLDIATCHGAMRIEADDLRLGAGDIRKFCALWGLGISDENAGAIAQYSDGWMIAVYLGLRAYRDTGRDGADCGNRRKAFHWKAHVPLPMSQQGLQIYLHI